MISTCFCVLVILLFFFFSVTNQPDRIRQFGLHRRKGPVVELPDSGGGLATPPGSQEANNDKAASSDSGIPPHELPRVAFHSPLLDYYSSLGGATLSPSSRPPAGGLSATIEPHRWTVNTKHLLMSHARAVESKSSFPCATGWLVKMWKKPFLHLKV